MGNVRKSSLWLSGILLALLLMAIGLLLNNVLGGLSMFKPSWPNNVYVYSIVLLIGLAIGVLSDKEWVKQVASLPTMIPSFLILFVSGVLLMIYPLGQGLPYFSLVVNLPLFLLMVFAILVLGVFIAKKFKAYKGIEKLRFLPLLGLMLFIIASIGGQYDYYQMDMRIGKDRAIFEGLNHDGIAYRTPFALKLLDIALPDDQVEVALRGQEVDNKMNVLDVGPVVEGKNQKMGDWSLQLEKYYPRAVVAENEFVPKDTATSVGAAYVKVLDRANTIVNEGWISSGSARQMPLSLNVDGYCKVSLLYNQDQMYLAQVRLFEEVAVYNDHSLTRSEGIEYKGWDISVNHYDARFGEQSPVLDLNLVFDRWFEVKYIALSILILGLLMLIKLKN